MRAYFGDGEYEFKLAGPQILELQRATGSGIGLIQLRVLGMSYGLAEITETLRLGLIGGGTDAKRSAELVATYSLPLAPSYAIVVGLIGEVFGEDPDKLEAPGNE